MQKFVARVLRAGVCNEKGDIISKEALEKAVLDIKQKKSVPFSINFGKQIGVAEIDDAYVDDEGYLVLEFGLNIRGKLVTIRFHNSDDVQKAKQILTKLGEEIVINEHRDEYGGAEYWEFTTTFPEGLKGVDFLRPCEIVEEHGGYSIGVKK